jgi:single-strand DNA-binding protein
MAISKFSIAVDRKFKRQGEVETDFFNCVAFGKQGEFVEKYLSKGNKILLTGRIENNNYTNREGQKVYSVQVSVEEVEFAESKQQNSGNSNIPKQDADGFMNIPQGLEEELPFE